MNSQFSRKSVTKIIYIVALAIAASTLSFAASGAWSPTGTMLSARDGHTATVLTNGKILAAGGTNNGVALTSAELYNPTAGTWASTGSMNAARSHARAVQLSNGSVLVVGGCVNDCLSATTNSAEIYTPNAGSFSATGSMVQARSDFGVTLLANGQVLVAGGCTAFDVNGCTSVTNKAEIYDPKAGTWKTTTALHTARYAMTATLLAGGKALVAGGSTAALDALNSSEVYDPTAKTWTLGGKMVQPRADYASIMLSTGTILFAGGENTSGVSIDDYIRASFDKPKQTGKRTWTGTILGADHFGNLITNFHIDHFPTIRTHAFALNAGLQPITRLALTFAECEPGDLSAIVGSSGYLEIAASQASAAKLLGCSAGSPVELVIY